MGVPINAALKALETVERELATLYAKLAEQFAADADLSSLFRRLAKDERSLQILVQYQQRMAHADQETFGTVDIDLELVKDLTSQVIAFRRSHPSPAAAEALKAAMSFETHAADRLHRTVLAKALPGFAALVGMLGQEDSAHRDTLARLLRSRSLV